MLSGGGVYWHSTDRCICMLACKTHSSLIINRLKLKAPKASKDLSSTNYQIESVLKKNVLENVFLLIYLFFFSYPSALLENAPRPD